MVQDDVATGGRRRRSKSRSARKTRKHRGGFVADMILAGSALAAAVYGRRMMKGGKRLPTRRTKPKYV
jgi:hypothetical protein